MPYPLLVTQTQNNSAPVLNKADEPPIDHGLAETLLLGKPRPLEDSSGVRETMVTGYHLQGLPFQIVVSSTYENEAAHTAYVEQLKKDLETEVNRMLFELLATDNQEAALEALNDRLSRMRSGTSACLSISLVYEKRDQLYACGVSLGKVGYVLGNPQESFKQLAPARYHLAPHHVPIANERDKYDLFFGLLEEDDIAWYREETLELSIDTSFHVEVLRGDEVLSYSQNIPEAYLLREERSRVIGDEAFSQKCKTAHYSLNPATLAQTEPTQRLSTQLTSLLRSTERPAFLMGKMEVPDRGTQTRLKKAVLQQVRDADVGIDLDKVKTATLAYLGWMKEHAKGSRIIGCRFTHLYHGDSGRLRAERILDMINREQPYTQIIIALDKAIQASSAKKHAYSRYLYDSLLKRDDADAFVNNKASFDETQKSMRLAC